MRNSLEGNTYKSLARVRVNISTNGDGKTKPDPGNHYYKKGTRLYISALPLSGSYFQGWSGSVSGQNPTRVIIINNDQDITANFFTIKHKLTIRTQGNGSVNLSPDLKAYKHGQLVQIFAVPEKGWRFSGWSGPFSGSGSTKIYIINSDETITASFIPVYTLSISTMGHGTTKPLPGIYKYDLNSRIYISALPDSGWKLHRWAGDITGYDSTQIVKIDSNKYVKVIFESQYFAQSNNLSKTYIANRNSREIHQTDCRWVMKMKESNKIVLHDFNDLLYFIKSLGYNGCFYCLKRYDRDTLSFESVIQNLETDSTR